MKRCVWRRGWIKTRWEVWLQLNQSRSPCAVLSEQWWVRWVLFCMDNDAVHGAEKTNPDLSGIFNGSVQLKNSLGERLQTKRDVRSPRLFSFLYPVCHLFIFPFLSLSIVPIYLPPAFFIPAIFLIAFFCTCRALYVNTRILKWILNLTGSQWRKVSVIWPLCPSIQLTES